MADPLAAFASRAGLKQRSLQSGLKLLKGKASGTIHPGLQPAHRSAVQLTQQECHVSEAPSHDRHQDQDFANNLQQYALRPQHRHSKATRKAHGQHHKVQLDNTDAADKQNGSETEDQRLPSPPPARTAAVVPYAKTIDPNHMQKLKQSLCQLMQDTNQVELQPASSATHRPLVMLLASKLDGADITAALAQYSNTQPPAQVQSHEVEADANKSEQLLSAARSSVACTPSPETVAQPSAHAEPQNMPERAFSWHDGLAVNAACSPAHATYHPDFTSSSSINSGYQHRHAVQQHAAHSFGDQDQSTHQLDFVKTSTLDILQRRSDWQQHDVMEPSFFGHDSDYDLNYQQHLLATPSAGLNRYRLVSWLRPLSCCHTLPQLVVSTACLIVTCQHQC